MLPEIALQIPVPGGSLLLVFALLFLVLPFVFAYWVYNDVKSRGDENAALWAVGAGLASFFASPFAGLLVVVVYVWQRDENRLATPQYRSS